MSIDKDTIASGLDVVQGLIRDHSDELPGGKAAHMFASLGVELAKAIVQSSDTTDAAERALLVALEEYAVRQARAKFGQ